MRPTPAETERILRAADLVTQARTAVETDYNGEILDAHAPEMPTRFAKQLLQLMRGACAIGLTREAALALTLRCARDSMPPLRLKVLDDVATFPSSRTREVQERIDKPYKTVDRQLQALHALGVLTCEAVPNQAGKASWCYRVAEGIDVTAIELPEKSGQGNSGKEKDIPPSDISGNSASAPQPCDTQPPYGMTPEVRWINWAKRADAVAYLTLA